MTWHLDRQNLKQKLCQNFEAFRKGLTCYPSAVYVKHFLSIEENKEDHCELVECLGKKKIKPSGVTDITLHDKLGYK